MFNLDQLQCSCCSSKGGLQLLREKGERKETIGGTEP